MEAASKRVERFLEGGLKLPKKLSTITKSSSREIDEKSLDIFFENLTFQEIFKSRTSMTCCIFAREITETSKFDINVQKF